jgi:dienelactone hydrolase
MFMTRNTVRQLTSAVIAVIAMAPAISQEQVVQLDYRINERVMLVPAGANHQARLETTVFKPNGSGPFPLIIINHGKDAGRPSKQARDRFYHMATAFVKRGYAVMVPMRQGFAASTGRYVDHGCDMRANGYTQADDVRDTLAFAQSQPWIDAEHVVIAGQSYGGLATMALGTEDLPGVRGLINFAGGLRDDSNGCDWRGALETAFADYGAKNRIPSLWMYGENDSLFGPDLAERLHTAFESAGGKAKLVEFPAFKRDAHGMLASRDGEKVWLADTERFLKQIGMPTAKLYDFADPPAPPKTDFAVVDDIAAVPFLSEAGRKAYAEYLTKMSPRAFALSPSGQWCWTEEGEDPDARALATCSAKSDQPCALYSVDDNVVWRGERGEPGTMTAQLTPPAAKPAVNGGAVGSTGAN